MSAPVMLAAIHHPTLWTKAARHPLSHCLRTRCAHRDWTYNIGSGL